MHAEFRHLDGATAGEISVVRQEFATIGRHPSTDITFDAQGDLEVSGRHAAVFRQGDHWAVRDLGSTNGTWVNDSRIKGDRALAADDIIRLGANGPRLVFRPGSGEPATVPATRRSPTALPGQAAPSNTTRIRAEVERQTGTWKRVTGAVTLMAALIGLGLAGLAWRENRAFEAERNRLLARADTALAQLEATTTTVLALRSALDSARRVTHRFRTAVAESDGKAGDLQRLSSDLTTRLDDNIAVVRAAEFDAAAILKDNGDAIALVIAEFVDGRRVAGTGFAVRVRGDTGWIATVRHLVLDSQGRSPTRLGVIFNGSNQNFRAEVAARADSDDVALLTVRIRGGVPVVRRLGGVPPAGDPVAILGYPFGFDFPVGGDWRRLGVSVSSFAGSISATSLRRLDIKGFGATGSSGSPLFNAAGEVIGVVFGGDPASAGGIVYATPVAALEKLLAAVLTRG